jgi:hypothetical protein
MLGNNQQVFNLMLYIFVVASFPSIQNWPKWLTVMLYELSTHGVSHMYIIDSHYMRFCLFLPPLVEMEAEVSIDETDTERRVCATF